MWATAEPLAATRVVDGPAGQPLFKFGQVEQGSPKALPPDVTNGPLVDIARTLSHAFDGDALVVSWHDGLGACECLYSDGMAGRDPAVAAQMEASAAGWAGAPGLRLRTHWQAERDGGTAGLLTTSLPIAAGVVTITTLFRRVGPSTRTRAADIAARYLPMLQPFFGLWAMHQQAAARAAGLAVALDSSDVGVVLVDRGGRFLVANAAADRLMASGDGFGRRGGTLVGANYATTVRLNAAIEDVIASSGPGGTAAAPTVIALPRPKCRPLMATVVPSRSSSPTPADSAVIVLLVDPDRDLSSTLEPVCSYYGLSPTEGRLACLLANGMSLGTASVELRIKELTARSYLKQIFIKTDTRRQVELVRLFLTNAIGVLRQRAGRPTPI